MLFTDFVPFFNRITLSKICCVMGNNLSLFLEQNWVGVIAASLNVTAGGIHNHRYPIKLYDQELRFPMFFFLTWGVMGVKYERNVICQVQSADGRERSKRSEQNP